MILEIARSAEGWRIRIDTIFYPGVAKPGPTTYTRGPEATLRVVGDRWLWTAVSRDGARSQDVEATFRLDPDGLVMPAWIRVDSLTWRYAHEQDSYEIRLEHDPRVVAEGSASLLGLDAGPTPITYSAAVRTSNATNGNDSFVTQFRQVLANGEVVELGELVEDPVWHAWFQREHGSPIGERRWERLSDAEWLEIRALPESAPPTAK